MDIHVCKQCGSHFVYCRACVFRPIRYKDNGFCSKECYEASKIKVVSRDEIESVKENILIEDIQPIKEEIEAEAVVTAEASTIETTVVVEPTIQKETNTYKKKKNKYRVHE